MDILYTRTVVSGSLKLMSDRPHQTLSQAEEHAKALIEAGAGDVTIQTAPKKKFVSGNSQDEDDHWEVVKGSEYWVWVTKEYVGPNVMRTLSTVAASRASADDRVRRYAEARRLITEAGLPTHAGDIWLGFLTKDQADNCTPAQIVEAYRGRMEA